MTKEITKWRSQVNLHLAENHYSQHIEKMDDPNNTPPMNGEQSNRRLEQTSSSQLPFNETSTRTGERNCIPEAIHTKPGKIRQFQCKFMLATICP